MRKEDYVLPWLRRMVEHDRYGAYFIFKRMEQGPSFPISVPKYPTDDPNNCVLTSRRSLFTHYYFLYPRDRSALISQHCQKPLKTLASPSVAA